MTKPGFSFLGSGYVVVYFVMDAYLLLLCFSFSVLSQLIGWEECLRNDLLCVEFDVNLNSVNHSMDAVYWRERAVTAENVIELIKILFVGDAGFASPPLSGDEL